MHTSVHVSCCPVPVNEALTYRRVELLWTRGLNSQRSLEIHEHSRTSFLQLVGRSFPFCTNVAFTGRSMLFEIARIGNSPA